MAKSKVKLIKCKKCGASWKPNEVPTNKEWTKIAPMPDKDGNVTITVMATWTCPQCGASVMGAKGKTKGEFKEEDTKKFKVEEALMSGEVIDLEKLAKETGVKIENLLKIIPLYQKKKKIEGEIKGHFFYPKK